MEELVGVLSDDEDFLELVNIIQHPRREQLFRERENNFTKWNDVEFINRFRLTKQGVRFLINEIAHLIESPTERNHALAAEEMVFLALRFYATGSFLQVVGDLVGVDKSRASRIVWRVSRAIAGLYDRFIKMPASLEEMLATSQEFYNISRFPRCIGALDCTHIRISLPDGNEPEIFRNRKGFFSFNVQVVCDKFCKFQDLVCRWPGSTHDAIIFDNSMIRAKFEHGQYRNKLLVSDSGERYGVRKYLITPLENPATPAENIYLMRRRYEREIRSNVHLVSGKDDSLYLHLALD